MADKHEVRVSEASVLGDRYRMGARCTCGWHDWTERDGQGPALAAAAASRVDHLLGAHPGQAPSLRWRPRAAAAFRHPCSIGAATQAHDGSRERWQREVACACGWTRTVVARSAVLASREAQERHRHHLTLQTARTPTRDYVVGLAVTLVVLGLIAVSALVVVRASGGDTSQLFPMLG